MKLYFLIIGLLLAASVGHSQNKTFIDKTGKIFEILEFKKQYSIDSCLIIEKKHLGYKIADTAQYKSIQKQWFGQEHTKYTRENGGHRLIVKRDIEGHVFLSSTMEGYNFLLFMMNEPPMVGPASQMNISSLAFYNILLVKEK